MLYLKTIYKFMPMRPEFVENRLLRLTSRVDLNDPYDYAPFESDIIDTKERHYASCDISRKELSDNHLNGVGIMSFTEAIDNIIMWSHYADGHKGMAIGFDPAHDFFKLQFTGKHQSIFPLTRVRYTTQRPDLRKEYAINDLPELLFKSDQWIYEKEWRICASFVHADIVWKMREDRTKEIVNINDVHFPCSHPHYAMVEVPTEAIQSITFGVNADETPIKEIKTKIVSTPSLNHIKLQRMEMSMDKYELKIEPI